MKISFSGTVYAHDAAGHLAIVRRQPPAPCSRKFYEDWYAPNNAILVITGDVDPQTIADAREATLPFNQTATPLVPAHAGD